MRDRPTVALAAVEDSAQGDVSVFNASGWYDITDYQLLDDEEGGISQQLADACSSAASECLGLVLREDASRVQPKVSFMSGSFFWPTGVALCSTLVHVCEACLHRCAVCAGGGLAFEQEADTQGEFWWQSSCILHKLLQQVQRQLTVAWSRCASPATCAARSAPRP